MAEKSKDRKVLNYMLRTATRLDSMLTVPASAMVSFTGVLLGLGYWRQHIYPMWLTLSIGLWITGALLAIFVLVPLLKRLEVLSEPSVQMVSPEFMRMSSRWNVLAAGLIALPLAILALMVIKPVLF
jgi:hypothetical protein